MIARRIWRDAGGCHGDGCRHRGSAPGASGERELRICSLGGRALDLLGLQLGNEITVTGALDDRVELRTVIGNQTDALDVDVIDGPAGTVLHHAVVHRDLGPLLHYDPGLDDRLLAVDGFAEITDRLA